MNVYRLVTMMTVAVTMTATASSRYSFTKERVAKGLTYYCYQGNDDITDARQTVYALKLDLDNERYKVIFHYGSDSTSAVAARYNAIAAINATYEPDATYIRVDGKNHHEVTIPSGHLRFWKHGGAITSDGERKIRILNGAPGEESSHTGGKKAIDLYKSLSEPNVFSGAPMLIDDYDPVGVRFVQEALDESKLKKLKYEDYRRHQGVRHPRTAVALTEDNDLILIVVDGRNPEAAGMTAKELTLFIARHFNPRWALNLDGGGSATMVIKGRGAEDTNVVNHPHDNHRFDHYGQRRICTHILIQEVN